MIDPDETIARPQGMNPSDVETTPPGESAAELVRVLDAYMAALQAGEAPDRSALLAQYPGLALQLEPCLAGIDFIHRAASPDASEAGPAMLGEFRIVREVGRGGMGVVYEAEQTSLRRRVALKVLRFGVVADEEAIRRFRVEAETVARLHHTNIVPIFAVGTEHDVSYYAMQFIDGRSLADVQEESRREARPIPADDVARWGLQAAEALAHAHQRRVIHRDIKPSNLLIDGDGIVWLTDFGLAKRSDEVTLTLSGTLMGTPRYMSPEQAEAMKRPVDHRTDLYSLGASLYELATGRPVFESATAHGVILQVLNVEPVAPRSVRPSIPRDLETILLTCLAKDPDRRYATAQVLVEDLRLFLEGRSIKARRTPLWEKVARFARRQRKSAAIGTIAAVAAVVLAGAGLALWRFSEESKLGKLGLSTSGEPFTAQVLRADSDERVSDPFTVPTRTPVALPEGDYHVRFSARGKLTETYQVRVEREMTHDYQVELSKRYLWPSGRQEPTDTTWRAYPFPVRNQTDLIEVDRLSVSRMNMYRDPVWSFKTGAPGIIPAGTKAEDWLGVLWPNTATMNGLTIHEHLPGVLQSMPDLDGDGIGDVVLSSRMRPFVFALSGKDGKILWHRLLPPDLIPPQSQGQCAGEPLVFVGPDGPILVSTFEFKAMSLHGFDGRRVEAIDGRNGRPIWQRVFARHDGRSIPAQRLRVDGKEFIGVVSGPEWVSLDPLSGQSIGEPLNFDRLAPREPRNPSFDLLREPVVADLDGDGSDDLLVLLAAGHLDFPEILAVSVRDRRRLWKAPVHVRFRMGDDTRDAELSRLRAADLDGDGRAEVILPFEEAGPPVGSGRTAVGLRVIDGRNGVDRWTHRLMIEREAKAPTQFIAGPDIDGDGIRELFVASIRPNEDQSFGNYCRRYFFVDALSGRNGKSLWHWSWLPAVSGDDLIRPLRWWEPGPDGFPSLMLDIGSAVMLNEPEVFTLEASTGRLLHQGLDFHTTGSGDLNGDGLPELWGTLYERPEAPGIRRVLVLGRPPEVWKRLERWLPGRDYDGDGVPDLIGPDRMTQREVRAISGRDGRVLWKAEPDRSGTRVWRGEAPLFQFIPLADKVGDLDGDGLPDLAVTRERGSDANRKGRMQVGLEICSGKTGKTLWKNPEIPTDGRDLTECLAYDVEAIEIDGRRDIIALLHLQDSPGKGKSLQPVGEFRVARFSGADGRLIAFGLVNEWHCDRAMQLPVTRRNYPAVRADLDGDGRSELIFQLPHNSAFGRPSTAEFVAISPSDGRVLWSRRGSTKLDQFAENDDAWSQFAAADLDRDGKAEVILTDRVEGRVRVERWDLASPSAPRWIWQGGEPDLGAIRNCSAVPGPADLDGSGHKSIVVIVEPEGGKRRVVVLDASGKVVATRPIESNSLKVRTHDLDGDGKDEIVLKDRSRLVALRSDLTTELWSHQDIGDSVDNDVKAFLSDESGKPTVVLNSLARLEGATGRVVSSPGLMINPQPIAGPDLSRPMVLSTNPFETSVTLSLPVRSPKPPVKPVVSKVIEADPRLVRPLPWVIGSPGGLRKDQRRYPDLLGYFAPVIGWYSFTTLVAPILVFRKMLRRKARIRDLLVLPISVAVTLGAFLLFRSEFMGKETGVNLPRLQAAMLAGLLSILGLPVLAVGFVIFRSLRPRGWRSVPGLLALWALGCVLAAVLLISIHHRDWMAPDERYDWNGFRTIWLPGLYVAGCLLIAWKILSWPVKQLVRLVRSRRPVA